MKYAYPQQLHDSGIVIDRTPGGWRVIPHYVVLSKYGEPWCVELTPNDAKQLADYIYRTEDLEE